jgi:hypothetical protein
MRCLLLAAILLATSFVSHAEEESDSSQAGAVARNFLNGYVKVSAEAGSLSGKPEERV